MKSNVLASGLAVVLGLTGVVGLADVAVAQASAVDDRKVEADRFLDQGGEQYKTSQFEAAVQSWRQAVKLYREIKDRRGEGQALGNLGLAYDNLGNYPKAIEVHEQSLAIAREIKNRSMEGSILGNLGNAYQSLGNYAKAIEFYEQSLAIAREIKNRYGEGTAIGNLGNVYQSLGNYAKAIEFHGRSLAIAREIKDRSVEGSVLGNLGLAYSSLGNYPKAIEFYEQSLVIVREIKDRRGEGTTIGNLGNAYDSLGNYPKAIEFLEQSLAIKREIKDRHGEGIAIGNLGVVHSSLGNYLKAIESYEQYLMIARELKDRRGEGTAIGNLGLAYSSLGNYPKAIEFLEQSLTIKREIKDRHGEGTTIGNLGLAYSSLGNYPKAIEFYEQSLAIAREIKDRNGERLALNNLGAVLTKQEPELAIVFYKQSVNVAESIRKENRKLDRTLQSSYTETVAGTYRRLADLLLSQGRVLEAQQVLELLKIQELRDYTRDASIPKTSGTSLNPVEQTIPVAHNDKIAMGIKLTQCEQTKCTDRPQLIAQRDTANSKFVALVDRLKKLLTQQQSQDPAQLQTSEFTRAAQDVILANPKTKTVLIYPLVLDDKLWLVWGAKAGKGAVVFDSKEIPVKRKDLSAKVAELQTLLKNPNSNPKDLQRISQQLYQWLLQPIRKQLDDNGIQNIVFSLDRATRYIPMATLHDGQQYLIENFSISTILTAKTDTQDKLSQNLLDDPILGLGLTQGISGFAPLPAVQTELDGIIKTNGPGDQKGGIYPGIKLFDRDFTETALRNNIADHRILHIATHGSFKPGNPEDSFLVLGDGKKLSISTIQSMTALANTHLVVLSACETGKGGVDKEGIEVAGIGHYFLLSGAKSVMASLWLVNDPATSLLMREFYSKLSQGKLTKSEALRQVQIAFLKGTLTNKDAAALDRAGGRRFIEGQPPVDSFAHPYYWAPFILIGNSQ